jgi:hypothetical protein
MSAALGGVELAGLMSLFFVALILHLGIRSPRILLAIAAMLAMGVCLTLGFATLVIGELNTLSMIFVVLFLVSESISRRTLLCVLSRTCPTTWQWHWCKRSRTLGQH